MVNSRQLRSGGRVFRPVATAVLWAQVPGADLGRGAPGGDRKL